MMACNLPLLNAVFLIRYKIDRVIISGSVSVFLHFFTTTVNGVFMLLRAAPLLTVFVLAACSTTPVKNNATKQNPSPAVKYEKNNSRIVPVNPVASSNNQCVDYFNFLRQAGNDKYQKYSREYILIGDGYTFLNTNKNIMNSDAKRVYSNALDMKLNTLCSEVNYTGFQVIQQKINALSSV